MLGAIFCAHTEPTNPNAHNLHTKNKAVKISHFAFFFTHNRKIINFLFRPFETIVYLCELVG